MTNFDTSTSQDDDLLEDDALDRRESALGQWSAITGVPSNIDRN